MQYVAKSNTMMFLFFKFSILLMHIIKLKIVFELKKKALHFSFHQNINFNESHKPPM